MAKKPKQPKDMSVLFSSSKGTLAQIASKTNSLNLLGDIVRQICPDLPEDVWHIANFRQNSLIIEVKSSVWSQRLQFERMNICRALSIETNDDFNQIEIKVSPYRNKVAQVESPTVAYKNTKHAISDKTAEQLRAVAKNAPPNLQKTLLRLAALANKIH